jgi:hypothetical protein
MLDLLFYQSDAIDNPLWIDFINQIRNWINQCIKRLDFELTGLSPSSKGLEFFASIEVIKACAS